MTKILVTGAAGFLGRRLTHDLLASGRIVDKAGEDRPIAEIVLADLTDPLAGTGGSRPSTDIAIRSLPGDLSDAEYLGRLCAEGFDSLFHLASQLTLQAELDPATAFDINVSALNRLIGRAEDRPKIIFTSSLAVFGGQLPDRVTEAVRPAPTTTYGTHKVMNELLVADQSRQGRIDGRCLRLPIVLTRPGVPLPAVSDQVASIIREPLRDNDVIVPLSESTRVPLASAGTVVRALRVLHDTPAANLPAARAINLPALTVCVKEMADAARRAGATGGVTYAPDAKTQTIVDGWPVNFASDHAAALGIEPEAGMDTLIADYLNHRGG